ncbi:DUF5691 domain-containing protein [Chitinophaga sp. 30R24]|uniref:DUF5691 domain-containing protein n=1 Tax=Chitinophaga sp. 30R24 TaxID=3248838 RepID=UPI003B904AB6
MERWNNIINTALLGTAKKSADSYGWNGPLQEAANTILARAQNREEQFLQLAAVLYNYRQSGIQPVTTTVKPPTICPAETKPYCSPAAIRVLQQVLETDSVELLQLWLEECTSAHLLLPPDQLPVILDKAWRNKPLRTLVAAAGGHRAEWLAQFNPDWHFSIVADTLEERWENGATDQRVEALKELRAADPVKARTWLEKTWPGESTAVKTALLGVLEYPADTRDLEWLESLLGEKSKQVKETLTRLLKKLPGSSINQSYQQVLANAVVLQENGSVAIALPPLTDQGIFQSGIEKISTDPKTGDDTHILYQLISLVQPAFWEQQFGCTSAEVIRLFQEDNALLPFTSAFVKAITWFEDRERATAFMLHSKVFYPDILPILPTVKQQELSVAFFDTDPETVIRHAAHFNAEWPIALCTKILRHAATQPYTYNQSFINHNIRQIPIAAVAVLDDILPSEPYYTGYWNNIKAHLGKLLAAKSRIKPI